jgi:hypothetical protein
VDPRESQSTLSRIASAVWSDNQNNLNKSWREFFSSSFSYKADKDRWCSLFLGTHLGDWDGVAELLNRLQIPELIIIKSRLRMRQNFTLSDDQELRRQIERLPQHAYRYFAEGEYWYRFHRIMRSSRSGALDTCYNRLANLPPSDPVTASEAYCLASLAAILLSGDSKFGKKMPKAHIPESPIAVLLTAVHQYLNTAAASGFQESVPNLPRCFEILFVPEDIDMLRVCTAQIRREIKHSRKLLDELRNSRFMYPFQFDLLLARQYKLEGCKEQADSIYKALKILRSDFILDEMHS